MTNASRGTTRPVPATCPVATTLLGRVRAELELPTLSGTAALVVRPVQTMPGRGGALAREFSEHEVGGRCRDPTRC